MFRSGLASARGALGGGAAPAGGVSGRAPAPIEGGGVAVPERGRGGAVEPRIVPVAEPKSGAPSMDGAEEGPRRFATDKGKEPTVAIKTLPAGALAFTADMDIDADGAGGWYRTDHTGQSETSLRYPDGTSLNPGTLPFIVVPLDFHKHYPDVKLGDYAAVSYNGKTMFAVIGDKGPAGVVGEGSIHLAASLGINGDPNRGGVGSGVQYTILPGTAGEVPRDAAEVQRRGEELLRQRGLSLGP